MTTTRTSGRIHLGTASPAVYRAMVALDREAREIATEAGLEPRLVELVKIRASQINGCAFCLDMHTRDAREAGETPERLAVLPAWRETSFFTEQERAALALAEEVTLVAGAHVPDAVYDTARDVLGAERLTAVLWLAVAINSWNRIAIASRYPVGE
ncbi:MAG: carboxymuconolactone decarboxylase family protein [Georgenia sp.]